MTHAVKYRDKKIRRVYVGYIVAVSTCMVRLYCVRYDASDTVPGAFIICAFYVHESLAQFKVSYTGVLSTSCLEKRLGHKTPPAR